MTDLSQITDPRVRLARVGGYDPDAVAEGIREVTESLGWADANGAFGNVVPSGAKVVVKPNWVLHRNQGPWGLEPLITNTALISAVVRELLRGPVQSVEVCDAPVQGCDWDQLCRDTGAQAWAERQATEDDRFLGLRDFRRTIRSSGATSENLKPLSEYVLFDLATNSLLEAITKPDPNFRVTQYNPHYLAKTHHPGKHQYLIGRQVLEADVVVNLPKLKTHKKAGVTSALKNLVGINGNKEYLPHHRVGGSATGGDCYPGRNPLKRGLEAAYDAYNISSRRFPRAIWGGVIRTFHALLHRTRDQVGIEGSWMGNDTVWRMSLDLNRILLYGRPDGTLAETPQRIVLHVVDAITAGQGDGPLASEPLPLHLLLAGRSAPALDWIGAQLLGYDASKVPIVAHSFDEFRWPLADFSPGDIELSASAQHLVSPAPGIRHPAGWRAAASGSAVEHR
jgi:uncharacterized protein (DUF362 family)